MKLIFARLAWISWVSFNFVSAKIPVNVDDLDPLKECKRWDVEIFESGNMVYMYGGSSWVSNGSEKGFETTNHYFRTVDFTSARDLSDRTIMTAKDIPGHITIFTFGAFWVDSGTAYVVGGSVPPAPWLSRQGEFLPINISNYKGATIFKYSIGADRWSSESALQPSNGPGVSDAFCCGAFAYNTRARKAFYYAGTNGAGATRLEPNGTPIYVGVPNEQLSGNSNLLTFDTPNFKWSNVTTNKQLTTSWNEAGQFVFLPGTMTSSGGIAILLGGYRRDANDMESMRRVIVYDSGTGSIYSQTTTAEGNFPPGRAAFCAVAASASDNSSHNIYVYGGMSPAGGPVALYDIWILSVPSFRWIRVDVNSVSRKSLACTTLAERYMLTYGGITAGWATPAEDGCDQENHGLRLFDLSSLAWTTRYDGPSSGGHAYKVPKLVYDAIGGNDQGKATQTAPRGGFETPGLSSLFPRSSPAPSSVLTSPNSPTGTNTPKKPVNVGAIAGGVVGGVVVLAIVIGGILYWMRQKKRKPDQKQQSAVDPTPPEMNGIPRPPREVAGSGGFATSAHEVAGSGGYATRAYEIDGRENRPPQEMYAEQFSPLHQNAVPARE